MGKAARVRGRIPYRLGWCSPFVHGALDVLRRGGDARMYLWVRESGGVHAIFTRWHNHSVYMRSSRNNKSGLNSGESRAWSGTFAIFKAAVAQWGCGMCGLALIGRRFIGLSACHAPFASFRHNRCYCAWPACVRRAIVARLGMDPCQLCPRVSTDLTLLLVRHQSYLHLLPDHGGSATGSHDTRRHTPSLALNICTSATAAQ